MEGIPYSLQPITTEYGASIVFLGSASLNSSWSEVLKRTKANKENSLVIEKKRSWLSGSVLESQQDFKWEEDQSVLQREEAGPVHTEAPGS